MAGVLEGFSIIATVVAVGWLLAHLKVLGIEAQNVLSKVAFYVASPALLLSVMQRTPLDAVLSPNLATAAVGAIGVGVIYLLITRAKWRDSLGASMIGALCAGYVNAGNLGIPIAQYVLGDVAWVAPTLLLQLLILTPVAMAVLDADARGERPTPLRSLGRMGSNPITLGAIAGLLLTLTDTTLPTVLARPIDLLGSMAVPSMLIAFGVSLRLGPKPATGGSAPQVWTLVALKTTAQPLLAWLVGAFVFGLDGPHLFAVVVLAALPTAQNVFTYAVKYNRAVTLSRDVVFISTFVSVPVIIVISALFHL